jgi:outer membrane protein assembly factor BamB
MSSKDRALIFSFAELAIWKTRLPEVQFAELPPGNDRPNPLVSRDRVFVSVFSPGAICALDRNNGKLVWRRKLGKFAGASVYLSEGKLFAKTSNSIFVLHPDSGEVLWSFCPYRNVNESIYSSPSVCDGRAYIGDRMGYLHCLDAANGQTIWKQRTSSVQNNQVNSTPLLIDRLAIVSTNAKLAIAYDLLSGEVAWKSRLDAPSIFGPIAYKDSILAISKSLYVLNPKTGTARRRYSWEDRRVHEVISTPRSIVVTFWPEFTKERLPSDKAEAERRASELTESSSIEFISNSGRVRRMSIALPCNAARYAQATRLLYVSHLKGIDVFRPTIGSLVFKLTTKQDAGGGIAPVDVAEKKIYVLTGNGTVYALRHPKV